MQEPNGKSWCHHEGKRAFRLGCPLVIVRKKNNKLGIRVVNETLKRVNFQLPQREKIEADLADVAYFTWFEANSSFHKIPLDDVTSRVCTFSTAFGRYRYLRLPFGLTSAPDLFQRTMNHLLYCLPGARVYMNDVYIWGETQAEHDPRLRVGRHAIQGEALALNLGKRIREVGEITYLVDKCNWH